MKPESVLSRIRTEKQYLREFFAEFIGTLILIAVGDASVAANILRREGPPDHISITFCFGVGALIGISAALPVSGAHINPAVTVALASLGKFPLYKVPHYLVAQFLGGFGAATVVYLTYFEAIDDFDGGYHTAVGLNTSTGFFFATYPTASVSILGALIDQIIGTAFLVFAVLAVIDSKGVDTPKHFIPTVFALVITALCIAFGYNCGATLNPARDIPTRLFTLIFGWKSTFAPLGGHYWWVAGFLGPHLGGIVGAWIYYLLIELHHVQSLPYSEANRRDSLLGADRDLKDEQSKEI